MSKTCRKYCTFRLSLENRIMLLEIKARSVRMEQKFDENEIINWALKQSLPTLLATIERIGMDEDLALLHEHIRMLEKDVLREDSLREKSDQAGV